jgi:hypothetical protein
MDKVTVLGDAIKYLKKLQEKVKVLEEEHEEKRGICGGCEEISLIQ